MHALLMINQKLDDGTNFDCLGFQKIRGPLLHNTQNQVTKTYIKEQCLNVCQCLSAQAHIN